MNTASHFKRYRDKKKVYFTLTQEIVDSIDDLAYER